jgi:hypothetical protein
MASPLSTSTIGCVTVKDGEPTDKSAIKAEEDQNDKSQQVQKQTKRQQDSKDEISSSSSSSSSGTSSSSSDEDAPKDLPSSAFNVPKLSQQQAKSKLDGLLKSFKDDSHVANRPIKSAPKLAKPKPLRETIIPSASGLLFPFKMAIEHYMSTIASITSTGLNKSLAEAAGRAAAEVAEDENVNRVQSGLLKRLQKIVKETESSKEDMAALFKNLKVDSVDISSALCFIIGRSIFHQQVEKKDPESKTELTQDQEAFLERRRQMRRDRRMPRDDVSEEEHMPQIFADEGLGIFDKVMPGQKHVEPEGTVT